MMRSVSEPGSPRQWPGGCVIFEIHAIDHYPTHGTARQEAITIDHDCVRLFRVFSCFGCGCMTGKTRSNIDIGELREGTGRGEGASKVASKYH